MVSDEPFVCQIPSKSRLFVKLCVLEATPAVVCQKQASKREKNIAHGCMQSFQRISPCLHASKAPFKTNSTTYVGKCEMRRPSRTNISPLICIKPPSECRSHASQSLSYMSNGHLSRSANARYCICRTFGMVIQSALITTLSQTLHFIIKWAKKSPTNMTADSTRIYHEYPEVQTH